MGCLTEVVGIADMNGLVVGKMVLGIGCKLGSVEVDTLKRVLGIGCGCMSA